MIAPILRFTFKLLVTAVLSVAASAQAATGQPRDGIRLLYFSSSPEIMQSDDKAGLAELASAIADQKRLRAETYFIDGGASLGPSVLGALDSGAHMVDILNAIGPEFMAIGKKEFAYGYDELIVNALACAFPLVTSNLTDQETGQQIDGTDPYFLLEGTNLTVGFVVLTSTNAVLEYGASHARALDADTTLKKLTDEIKDLGADAIFLMADTDYDDLSKYREAGYVDGIFYTHNFGNPYTLDHQGVLHTEGPLDGKLLAVDLWLDSDGSLHTEASLIDIAAYPPEPAIAELIRSYKTRLSERLSPPIAKVLTPFNTLRANVRSRENAFGNFVADALKTHLHADAVLINGGAIRGNREYAAGTMLNRGNIQRELPFGNRAALLKLKGSDIIQALEHGLDCLTRADGCALQVSNLRVLFDSARPAGQRILDIEIKGKPLDPEHYYLVAVSEFIAAGNDGYEMLRNGERITNRLTNRAMWDLVAEYAEQLGEIAPKEEGRLTDKSPSNSE